MQLSNRTYMAKKENVECDWHLFDARGKRLGNFATEVASALIGKHKPTFTPHFNVGDKVVVINASDIEVSANKMKTKKYFRHTGYPGGIRELSLEQMMAKNPSKVIEKAVKRMLPQNKLTKERMRNLFVYAGPEHKHEAQLKGKESK
jgi:large subunit ribosomal protein L13